MVDIKQDGLEWVCNHCGARFSRSMNAVVHNYKEHQMKGVNKTTWVKTGSIHSKKSETS